MPPRCLPAPPAHSTSAHAAGTELRRCQEDRLQHAGCQGEQLNPLGLSTLTQCEDIILWHFTLT